MVDGASVYFMSMYSISSKIEMKPVLKCFSSDLTRSLIFTQEFGATQNVLETGIQILRVDIQRGHSHNRLVYDMRQQHIVQKL